MEVCLLSHEVMLQPLSVPITGSAFAFSIFLLPAFHKVPLRFPRSTYSTVWVRLRLSADSFVSMYPHCTGG